MLQRMSSKSSIKEVSLPNVALPWTGTSSGPSMNDVALPSAKAIAVAAVAVVRWLAGNHVADMQDGAAYTTQDDGPSSACPSCIVQ